MGYNIKLYKTADPANKIGKNLQSEILFTCLFKEDTSILHPVVIIRSNRSEISQYNYMYIQELSRYYFIDDIVSVNDNTWKISAHVDVLESFKSQILNNDAIIEGTELTAINKYIYQDDVFVTTCKHKTDIIPFSGGLLDTGEFILITAGG